MISDCNKPYCPKCGSKLMPIDEEYIEKVGVCSYCVTYDHTPDQRYKKMWERIRDAK